MPAKDKFHDVVKNSLVKDGWTITDDPLTLEYGRRKMFVDLAAERLFTAEKDERKIAVEVKSFLSLSELADLEEAFGQFAIYQALLKRRQPDRRLYLAIPQEKYLDLFAAGEIGSLLLEEYSLSVIVFEIEKEVITQWIN